MTQTVLSIESGTPYLSLGVTVNGRAFSRVTEVGRTHAERLPAELEALFAEAALSLRADKIVIGTGPGSYTGLRVGASYALGLGRAWGVPVLGVCTLEGLAGTEDGTVAVSLDARKEHVYGAVYRLAGGVVAETLHPRRQISAGRVRSAGRRAGLEGRRAARPAGAGAERAASRPEGVESGVSVGRRTCELDRQSFVFPAGHGSQARSLLPYLT